MGFFSVAAWEILSIMYLTWKRGKSLSTCLYNNGFSLYRLYYFQRISQDCHQLHTKIYSFLSPLDTTVLKPVFNPVLWRVEASQHHPAYCVGQPCHRCQVLSSITDAAPQRELLIRNLHFLGRWKGRVSLDGGCTVLFCNFFLNFLFPVGT